MAPPGEIHALVPGVVVGVDQDGVRVRIGDGEAECLVGNEHLERPIRLDDAVWLVETERGYQVSDGREETHLNAGLPNRGSTDARAFAARINRLREDKRGLSNPGVA